MPHDSNVTHWINLVKDGDSVAANEIWQHYFNSLVRIVRNRLQGQNRAIADEEDIVLSVFNSFYDAAQRGRFPNLADRDSLWQVLLKMSVRKVIDKRRHDNRTRRGGGAQPVLLNDDEVLLDVVGDDPSPEMALVMQETFERFFAHLGQQHLQAIASAKLEGYSNAEIAAQLGCSERTVERRLHLIREKCQQQLLAPERD